MFMDVFPGPFMPVNVTVLMNKLVAIEKAIGKATDAALLSMVLDAQECLLGLQKEWLALPSRLQ